MARSSKLVSTAICKLPIKLEEQDTCIGSVSLVRDITAEKEVDQMKTDFITNVSHELRTPLTKILGFIKMINKKLEDHIFPRLSVAQENGGAATIENKEDRKLQRAVNQVRDNLDIISAQSQHLMAIITDVLDIAQMEAGKVDWQMQPLSIATMAAQIIDAESEQIQAKGLKLVQAIDPDLPLVNGNRERLCQVMTNILSNAIKFTDSGTIVFKATLDESPPKYYC
jgi:signal transduction histidine kinase